MYYTPNLFIAGAAKSGTSSLHNYLHQHPNIFMSEDKEPHFFSHSFSSVGPDPKCQEEYLRLFSNTEQYSFRGESSTGYMVFPNVVENIQKNLKNTPKFIFLLRNPIERAYSHYWWLRGRGVESRSLREAVSADMGQKPDPKNPVKGFGGYYYYFAFGQYGTYISPFIRTFGPENILTITTTQLKKNAVETLNLCFSFLTLPRYENISIVNSNETIIYSHPKISRFFHSLGSQSIVSKVLKKTLSKQTFYQLLTLRNRVAHTIDSYQKSRSSYPPPNVEDHQWLQQLYTPDVKLLRQMTNQPFQEWAEDFPL